MLEAQEHPTTRSYSNFGLFGRFQRGPKPAKAWTKAVRAQLRVGLVVHLAALKAS